MKKIIFAIGISLFAVATAFNMNMLTNSDAADISLESIAVMAQAQAESGGNDSCIGGRWQTVYNTGTWSGCDGNDYVEYSGGGSFEYCTTTGAIKNDNTYYIETSRSHNDPRC